MSSRKMTKMAGDVARRVDIGGRCAAEFVDDDTILHLQASIFREDGLRDDTHPDHHHIRVEVFAHRCRHT